MLFLCFYDLQTMLYYPRMPGNSCNLKHVASNNALQEAHMNPNVLQAAQRDCTEEKCAVFTLSDILHHFMRCAEEEHNTRKTTASEDNKFVGRKRPVKAVQDVSTPMTARRVALLKIDVEGDELEVVRSIEKSHWMLIDRIIAESHPNNTNKICALLQQAGFCESNIWVEKDGTGNSFIFASRL